MTEVQNGAESSNLMGVQKMTYSRKTTGGAGEGVEGSGVGSGEKVEPAATSYCVISLSFPSDTGSGASPGNPQC